LGHRHHSEGFKGGPAFIAGDIGFDLAAQFWISKPQMSIILIFRRRHFSAQNTGWVHRALETRAQSRKPKRETLKDHFQ
jgi:hypothetical protein